MLYPQTIEELEHVLIVDFRFDRGHDYFIRDGKIALGIDEANIPTLKRRIGDQWEVRVLRRVEHTQDYVFCRVDIVPKEIAALKSQRPHRHHVGDATCGGCSSLPPLP